MLKKHEEKTVNPPARIYINKIENRITFKIKTGYYAELLISENVPNLEIKVVLVICNIVKN